MVVVALDAAMRADVVQGREMVQVGLLGARAGSDGALGVAVAKQGQGSGLRGFRCCSFEVSAMGRTTRNRSLPSAWWTWAP
jgi:hypothetical protein